MQRLLHLCVVLTLLSGCTDNLSALKEINRFDQSPIGITENLYLIYSDSAFVEAILEAEKNIDFTNQKFPYSEFPEGLKVTFLDELMNENIVLADFGTLYNGTSIIDLVGNVSLTSSDGSVLTTEQLYWDANNDWIFTEKEFRFVGPEYNVLANRLDTNKEFTKFQTGKLTGTVAVKDEPVAE